MRIFFLLLLFTIGTLEQVFAQNTDDLRFELFSLDLNPQDISNYLSKLDAIESPSPLIMSYKGSTCAFLAKYLRNPFKKIYYLNRSNNYLNDAVELEPGNLEIRFIRFLTQSQIPGIMNLGYDVRFDKTYIVDHLDELDMGKMDNDMQDFLSGFLHKSRYCTSDEAEMLSAQLFKD